MPGGALPSDSAYFVARRTCSARNCAVQAVSSWGDRSRNRLRQRRQGSGRIGEQLDLAAPVLPQLLPVVAEANEARIGIRNGGAVGRLVIELASHDDHDIGVLHRFRAHRAYHRWMLGRNEIAAFLGVDVHGARPVQEFDELFACPQCATTRQHQRPPRLRDDPGGPFDVSRVRRNMPWWFRRQPFGQDELRRHRFAQHVGGNLDVHGARRIAIAASSREGLVEVPQHVVSDAQRARRAGDRTHDIRVGDSLQRAEIVLRARRAAADQHDRHAFELRVGHRGDAIGDARARGHHRDADATRQNGMRVRHVHRRAFVAHVDDAHSALAELVPDRLNVAALQAEHAVGAAGEQEIDDEFGYGSRAICHPSLRRSSIFAPVRRGILVTIPKIGNRRPPST